MSYIFKKEEKIVMLFVWKMPISYIRLCYIKQSTWMDINTDLTWNFVKDIRFTSKSITFNMKRIFSHLRFLWLFSVIFVCHPLFYYFEEKTRFVIISINFCCMPGRKKSIVHSQWWHNSMLSLIITQYLSISNCPTPN
jgi:hypothetical protein